MVIKQPEETPIFEERRTNFIGRIQEQRQFRVALAGLLDHHRHWRDLDRRPGPDFDPDRAPADESYTRIFLLHGIGGIGKSWLSQRCLALAQAADYDPAVLTLYDDVSLGAPVLAAADLLERLYRQLVEAGYEAEVAAYRQVQAGLSRLTDRVTRYRLEDRERWQALIQSVAGHPLATAARPTLPLEKGEAEQQPDEAASLARANELLLAQMQQAGHLTPAEVELLRDPAAVQAARLVAGLKQINRSRPLIIVLDNLETLVPLEPFIRDHLVLPAIHLPVFWILSGRYNLADERVVEIEGQKRLHKGYRDLLGENPPLVWDMSAFGDAELHEYLETEAGRRHHPLLIDDNLIAAVKATSSGVPLVVEMVADALFTLERDEFLQNFVLDDKTLLPANRLEQITSRFLRYCLTREDDLERVQGLALLRKGADSRAIRAVWALSPQQRVADVLEQMRMRYAFVQADGLHDAVYEFVRRQLHTLKKQTPIRERLSGRAVDYCETVWAQLHDTAIDPVLRSRAGDWQEASRALLDAYLWADPDRAISFFLPRFVEGLGFDRPFADELLRQIEEFLAVDEATLSPAQAGLLTRLRAGLKDLPWLLEGPSEPVEHMLAALLETPELTPLHRSILYLWQGRGLVGQGNYHEALTTYLRAVEHLPATAADLRRQLARAFYQLSSHFLWPERVIDIVPSLPGLQAVQQAVSLDPDNGDAWYNLGLALEALEQAEESIPAFQRAIELEPRPVHYNSLGDALMALERYDEAMEAYRQALVLDPAYAWPYHGLGLIHTERGEYEQAIVFYQQALERHQHNADRAVSWDGLGDVYSALGRDEAAIEAYEHGLKLNPNDALLWYSLGNIYSKQAADDEAHYNQAVEVYRRAIELDPGYAWAYHNLGLVYARRGQHSLAMILYQQALERHQADEARAVSWNSLGDVYGAMSRDEAAIEAYQQALAFDPAFAPAWNSLGELYNRRSDYAQAVAAYRRSIDLQPNLALPWYNLGNAYSAQNRLAEAMAAYRRAIELDPDDAWPYNNLGFLYQKLGDGPAAIALYRQALERHEDGHGKAVSWDNLGNAYRALGDEAEAISAYRWASAQEPAYAWPYHNLGLVYAEQGKHEQAVALYQQAIERHKNAPALAASWHKLGEAYQALGRSEEAINAYQRVIELNPDNALPWANLGDIYLRLDRPQEVLEAYRRAIQLDPTRPWPYHNLGRLHARLGQPETAIPYYQQALDRHEHDRDRAIAWNDLGDAYKALDRLDQANGAYRQAIQLAPDYAWPYHNLGLIYSESGEPDRTAAYETALTFLQQAIERHEQEQDRGRAWHKVGRLYYALNRFEEAIDAYEQALELDPQEVPRRAWNDLGDVYRAMNRLDEAIESYQRATTVEPAYGRPYHNLGLIYAERGHYKSAIAAYQQALERLEDESEQAQAWTNLGQAYEALHRSEEAIEAYRRAIELDPHDARPHNNLGNVYQALDRIEAAIASFQQAIELEPDKARPRNSLGDLYRVQGRLAEAEAAYRRAIELEPAYVWPYHSLGLICEQQGRPEEALAFYQQAVERHEQAHDQAVVWTHLGDVYRALGREEKAPAAYRQAIELEPAYARPYHNLGLIYTDRAEYETAAPYFQQAIERYGQDVERLASWHHLGDVYRLLDRQQEAVDAYQQVVKLDPAQARAWNSLGTAYTALEHYEVALAAFERAIDLEPTYAWAYHNLGFVHEKQAAYQQAIPFYQQAIEHHQNDADSAVSWNNLGNAFAALERSEEAIRAYRQAIELDPAYALPWDSLGDVYRALNRSEEAGQAYGQAIELDPTYPWPYHNLGLIYKDQDQPEAALPLLQQAIERHQNDEDRAVSWHHLGNAYSALGRSKGGSYTAQAIDAYRRAIELNPAYAWPYHNLAFVYAEQGAYQQALTLYQQAIERHENDQHKAGAWDNLGNAFSKLGRLAEAIRAYRQAIALDPERALPWYNLGNTYRSLERLEEGIKAYRQAIKLDPHFARPWNSLGDIYRALKRSKEAEAAYEQAIELDPAYVWPYRNLAALLADRGLYEEAIAHYRQAIELHERSEQQAVLWHELGNLYRLLGRPQAAINAYKQAGQLDPGYALPWYDLGNLYAALEQDEAAMEAYRQALKLAPNDAWTYHNLGLVYEKQEAYQSAASYYRQAIERHQTPQDRAMSWYSLGNVYSKEWQYAQAVKAYWQAIEQDPTLALPWSSLGDVYSAMRYTEQAINAYRRAIELNPAYAPAYNNLGFVYEQLGEYEQAMALYRQVIEEIEDHQDRAISWNNLGNVYRALGQVDQAVEAYRQAIEADPDYTWPYHNLGAIYEQRGQNEEALAFYQQATGRHKAQASV